MDDQFLNDVFKCIQQNRGGVEIKYLSNLLQIKDSQVITEALEKLLILEVVRVKRSMFSIIILPIEHEATKH